MTRRPGPLVRRHGCDNDYTLRQSTDNVWIAINNVSLCIVTNDETVEIRAWPNHNEAEPDYPLAALIVAYEDAADLGGEPCTHSDPT